MKIRLQQVKQKHYTLYSRIAKVIKGGKFATYTVAQKQALYDRLLRYENRLKSWGVAVASSAALFLAPMSVSGQIIFAQETGTNNPLAGFDVGDRSTPTFVDIDNDGDFDAFVGEFLGTVKYYKNIGSNSSPVFAEQTGADNPLAVVNQQFSVPTFVDIDNDGDFDAFVGEFLGTVKYYKNIGSNNSPAFAEQTGTNNPLHVVNTTSLSAATFVDIDNDGDFDAFVLMSGGTNIFYYENTGSNSSPAFTQTTGSANPFNGVHSGSLSTLTFVDIDNDGDFDAFTGTGDADINYYKNTGSNSSPAFTKQTGADNPFSGIVGSYYYYHTPIFVDIDNDGDFDAFLGEYEGGIKYYKNLSSVVPVELTSFNAETTENGNLLTWATATEENNAGFEVEKSTDARTFEKIGFVVGNGTTYEQQTYEFLDNNATNGVTYYRLKQMDFDGKFEYSNIVSISDNKAAIAEMLLYPNPVKNFLTIENGEGTATIFNALGQPLQQFNITDTKYFLNTNELPKGIYTLQVRKADGTATVKQFVK